MPVFLLTDLHSTLLEKIITKLHYKSYFRLQQSCRSVLEFIRSNRNISVYSGDFYTLKFYNRNRSKYCCGNGRSKMALTDFYGTRLAKLDLRVAPENLERICYYLKKCRIMFNDLFILAALAEEEVRALLNIAIPVRIFLNSEGSTSYEAIFKSTSLETAVIRLFPGQVAHVAPRALATFPEVVLQVLPCDAPLDLIRMILRFLRTYSFPKLRRFHLNALGNWDWSPFDEELQWTFNELQNELCDYNLKMEKNFGGHLTVSVDIPHLFNQNISCKIHLECPRNIDIFCGVGNVEQWAYFQASQVPQI